MTVLPPRTVKLTTRTGTEIRRNLPHKDLRMIGAWCFVDHFGPTDQVDAMSVAAHPHAGLQTVSWLFEGDIEHRDSLGSIQRITPGQLNIMTSGSGIAHSELSTEFANQLHGVQLWVALPDVARHTTPLFDHYADLPHFSEGLLSIRLFAGELLRRTAQTRTFSELLGAEIRTTGGTSSLPVNSHFEHGVLAASGSLTINGEFIEEGALGYFPAGLSTLEINADEDCLLILLGGAPFDEEILMWWNFIARTQEEIEALRNDWNSTHPSIPAFNDKIGGRIPAPDLPHIRMTARGNK